MLSPWKYDLHLESLFWPLHGNCFIFIGHIHLPLELCTAGLFWPFDLDITITLKILSDSLLENYKWQMLHIFRAYQTKETRKTFLQTNMKLANCYFDLCSWKLWFRNLVLKLLFSRAPMSAFVMLPQPQETVLMAQSSALYPKIDWSQIMLCNAIQAVLSITE